MSTKQENRRADVIRCEYCGEDYSITYRHCPFCDDKASYGSGSAPARGGRRVATNKRGGGYGGKMDPVQIIGLVLSVILIIAAVYIVISVLSPLLGRSKPTVSGSQPNVSGSQPNVSVSQPGGEASSSSIPDVSGSSEVITPIVTATGITLNTKDITLQPDETHRIVAALAPADCTDTIIWTSSNESVLMVSQDGTVTNVNKGSSQVTITVTAQVGDLKAACLVRCKPGSTGTGNGTSTTPTTPVASGTTGTVTGTTTGLRIRSGPGTNYAEQDSALNGAQVTILEQTGDGWYKINYTGKDGKTKTGYVSKDYIKVN